MIMLYVVLSLIAVAYYSIVLARSQIVKRLSQIIYVNSYTAVFLYLIAYVARGQKCYRLSLDVATGDTVLLLAQPMGKSGYRCA